MYINQSAAYVHDTCKSSVMICNSIKITTNALFWLPLFLYFCCFTFLLGCTHHNKTSYFQELVH